MSNEQGTKIETSDEEIRKLVIARLSVISSDMQISIGSDGSFSRDEMIDHVNANDDIGQKIEAIELVDVSLPC